MKEQQVSDQIIFVGLDVDDQYFHGHTIDSESSTERAFKCKPTVEGLVKVLSKVNKNKKVFKICYESGHLGFSLQRQLVQRGYHCDVAATSLIPQIPGKRVKTDRVDTEKLVRYYAQGSLTLVHVPDEREEMIRNLIRSRDFLKGQTKRLKLHLLSICRIKGLHYRAGAESRKSYWTKSHFAWLEQQKNRHQDDNAFCFNMSLLLNQLAQMDQTLSGYEAEIQRIAGETTYVHKVKALTCYRGIDILSAMTLIVEIGDVKRFSHPAKLCSYAGLDIQEYSSGGKER